MTRIAILALLALVVAVPTGAATTLPSMIVRVDVALKPGGVTLSSKRVPRGDYVRFKVRNTTARRRMFSIAGRTIAIPPRTYRLLAISFVVRGTYRYASRAAAGTTVHGTFVVS